MLSNSGAGEFLPDLLLHNNNNNNNNNNNDTKNDADKTMLSGVVESDDFFGVDFTDFAEISALEDGDLSVFGDPQKVKIFNDVLNGGTEEAIVEDVKHPILENHGSAYGGAPAQPPHPQVPPEGCYSPYRSADSTASNIIGGAMQFRPIKIESDPLHINTNLSSMLSPTINKNNNNNMVVDSYNSTPDNNNSQKCQNNNLLSTKALLDESGAGNGGGSSKQQLLYDQQQMPPPLLPPIVISPAEIDSISIQLEKNQQCACKDCGKLFNSVWYLKQHAVKHSNDRPFKCKFCLKTYKFRSNLYQHKCPERNRHFGGIGQSFRKRFYTRGIAYTEMYGKGMKAHHFFGEDGGFMFGKMPKGGRDREAAQRTTGGTSGASGGTPSSNGSDATHNNSSSSNNNNNNNDDDNHLQSPTNLPFRSGGVGAPTQETNMANSANFCGFGNQPHDTGLMVNNFEMMSAESGFPGSGSASLYTHSSTSDSSMFGVDPFLQSYAGGGQFNGGFMPLSGVDYGTTATGSAGGSEFGGSATDAGFESFCVRDRPLDQGYIDAYIQKHKSRVFACRKCKLTFPSEEYLERHNAYHNTVDAEPFSCDQCPQRFTTEKQLQSHFLQHSDNSPHRCVQCGGIFRSALALRRHRVQCRQCYCPLFGIYPKLMISPSAPLDQYGFIESEDEVDQHHGGSGGAESGGGFERRNSDAAPHTAGPIGSVTRKHTMDSGIGSDAGSTYSYNISPKSVETFEDESSTHSSSFASTLRHQNAAYSQLQQQPQQEAQNTRSNYHTQSMKSGGMEEEDEEEDDDDDDEEEDEEESASGGEAEKKRHAFYDQHFQHRSEDVDSGYRTRLNSTNTQSSGSPPASSASSTASSAASATTTPGSAHGSGNGGVTGHLNQRHSAMQANQLTAFSRFGGFPRDTSATVSQQNGGGESAFFDVENEFSSDYMAVGVRLITAIGLHRRSGVFASKQVLCERVSANPLLAFPPSYGEIIPLSEGESEAFCNDGVITDTHEQWVFHARFVEMVFWALCKRLMIAFVLQNEKWKTRDVAPVGTSPNEEVPIWYLDSSEAVCSNFADSFSIVITRRIVSLLRLMALAYLAATHESARRE